MESRPSKERMEGLLVVLDLELRVAGEWRGVEESRRGQQDVSSHGAEGSGSYPLLLMKGNTGELLGEENIRRVFDERLQKTRSLCRDLSEGRVRDQGIMGTQTCWPMTPPLVRQGD